MRICAEVSLLPSGLGWVNLVGIRSSALMRLSIVLISDMGEADHIYIFQQLVSAHLNLSGQGMVLKPNLHLFPGLLVLEGRSAVCSHLTTLVDRPPPDPC